MADWVNIAREGELPVGQRAVADTDAGKVAVFNIGGTLLAIEDVCSHDGGELASGVCIGDQIACPRHGAKFCLRTGKALTPPAYEDIATFPVRVEDGWVQVDLDG